MPQLYLSINVSIPISILLGYKDEFMFRNGDGEDGGFRGIFSLCKTNCKHKLKTVTKSL